MVGGLFVFTLSRKYLNLAVGNKPRDKAPPLTVSL
jgi:hypothetical protein